MKESTIWKLCHLVASKCGLTIFRNNIGKCWIGKSRKMRPGEIYKAVGGEVIVFDARYFEAGLFTGSGDGIGWRTLVITPEMVGKKFAQFASVETKTESGRVSKEQLIWHQNVLTAGGFSMIVRHPDELEIALTKK